MENIVKLLNDVFNDYENTFQKTNGKAVDVGSPSQYAITKALPDFFKSLVASSEHKIERYKFKGSFGQIPLNMTDTPWVATFDSRITTSAQKGYDIVLLFAKDMKSCVLSLNQGYKAFTDEFKTESLALKKILQTADKARAILPPISGASYGPIDLKSNTSNARGYELGAIASYTYYRGSLPTEEVFKENFFALLKAYDQLYQAAGANLTSLQSLTDAEFQSEIEAVLATNDYDEDLNNSEPEPPPHSLSNNLIKKYKRDVLKAQKAIRASGFKCEVDNTHHSFISAVSKKMYLEAHHLIPMAAQANFEVSLDVVPNIISLCPNCHRMIHHATFKDKVLIIKKLMSNRESSLAKKGIYISEQDLLNLYKKGIDEAD